MVKDHHRWFSHDGNPKQFGDAAARPRQFAVRCCHRLYRALREDSRSDCRRVPFAEQF